MQAAVLLGAPGSGKGTIAAAVSRQSDFRHISTGYVIRQEMKNPCSRLGAAARVYMERSEYVPDELALELVSGLLVNGGLDAKILFDGFPRTEMQGRRFEDLLKLHAGTLSGVFLLEAAEPVLVERLQGRRTCEACGAIFNRIWNPPRIVGVCNDCAGRLVQRVDDFEENIIKRLKLHEEAAHGLIRWYDEAGLLTHIDASQDPDISAKQILAVLKK
ncbi:MAG: adenylate kinase [Candidatus Omnitrophota bacterium]|jgi:adenylate kinase